MSFMSTIITAFALAAAAGPNPSSPTLSSELKVAFAGIERTQGSIMVALFSDEAGYKAGKPIAGSMVAASATGVSLAFQGLAPGRYAIKAFHDINGNGRMDANPFGMPTEPFAFSNDAKGRMGPAAWADAAFVVVAGTNAHRIAIR